MIKYLVMDVDGTLTDGKIYMGADGEIMKAFSVKDGYAVNSLLKDDNIVPIIITARKSMIVEKRCAELGIKEIHQGKIAKLETLLEIVGENCLKDCAYFGDDILDLECMTAIRQEGGVIGCPLDAAGEVRAIADYVCNNCAGAGALREFVEWMLSYSDDLAIEDRIAYAIDHLEKADLTKIKPGKCIVNDFFYFNVIEYVTAPKRELILESHKEFIDIQLMLDGEEIIQVADISRLRQNTPYSKEEDKMTWKPTKNMLKFTMKKGDIAILYPNDAHEGGISIKNNTKVLKVVGKVRCR